MNFMFKEARAEAHELLRKKEHKTPWQPIPVVLGAACPVVLFAWVYYCCFSGLRFYHPERAALLGFGPALAACVVVSLKTRQSLRAVAPARGPFALAACLWVALALAALGGEENYRWHMLSYYQFQDLAAYTNIDPSLDKGQSYMDAGQVYFREDSRVATEQMVVFRSDGVYCAAPIISQPIVNQDGEEQVEQDGPFKVSKSYTVDFWAVGMDCCDQETKVFTCGAVPDNAARAGIRLLRDDIRPFYLLAVQQWAARLCPVDDNTAEGRAQAAPLICPQARHPLFFHWVRDPLLEVDTFYDKAMHMYRMHLLTFAIWNFGLLLGLLWLLFFLGLK